MRIADRIVLMRAGRIIQVGTGEELYRTPASLFAARFFCDFTEVEGWVAGGAVDTPLGRFAAPDLPEGSDAIVCIRPHRVRIVPKGYYLPGRLVARRFLGAVEGFDRALSVRASLSDEIAVGDEVGVEIPSDEVLVFPAADQ